MPTQERAPIRRYSYLNGYLAPRKRGFSQTQRCGSRNVRTARRASWPSSLSRQPYALVSVNRLGFHSLCNASPCVSEVKKQQLIAAICDRPCQFQALSGVTSAFVGRHSHPPLTQATPSARSTNPVARRIGQRNSSIKRRRDEWELQVPQSNAPRLCGGSSAAFRECAEELSAAAIATQLHVLDARRETRNCLSDQ
jgi:hypothetical protein